MMEALQATHRKQLKDLQARITQKKKQATKKTRKGVNDECDALERELKGQQAAELAALSNPDQAREMQNIDDSLNDLAINADSNNDSTTPAMTTQPAAPLPSTPQQDANDSTSSSQLQDPLQRKKPNRARERLARRQAEQEALFARAEREASDLPNLKNAERARMLLEFRKRNLEEKEIRADGHCLYSAVADQLLEMGVPLKDGEDVRGSKPRIQLFGGKKEGETEPPFRLVRKAAAEYIGANAADFEPFLEEPLADYVVKIRDTGEWGGQLELMALAKTYGVGISVLQGDGRVEEIEGVGGETKQGDEEKRIWLAYYRHGFGLGEHYNSLHRADS